MVHHTDRTHPPPMSVFLYLLPLGLIFDLAGYLPPALRLFLIYGLLGLPLLVRPSRAAGWLAAALAAAIVLRAWLPFPPLAETALLLLLHQLIWTVLAPVPRALHAGVVVFAALDLFLFRSPLGHPLVEGLARAGNTVSEWITDNSFHLGWTWQNLGALLLFATLSLFSWNATRVGQLRTLSFLVVALLLNALGATVLIEQANFAANYAWKLEFRDPFGFPELWARLKDMALLVFPAFLFLAQLAAFMILHFGRRPQADADQPEPPHGWPAWRDQWRFVRPVLVVTALAAALLLLATPPTSWRRPVPRELVFLERGVVSFTSPDYTRFGKMAGGMFGKLPDYARLFGCNSTVVKEIPAVLTPGQVLVITNLDEDLGAETRARIWKFVADGGALWVLGDHTFIKNGRNHLNELLAPTHISLKNDSAQFFPQGWFNSYHFIQGTPFGALRDDAENRPGILVGASLDLRAPAQPFILGRHGYSDWGLEQPDGDRGYLGDFKYQPSERLGDLVLVAGERHGKGRVLVFGDTSSFFATNLSRSYELLRASLSWLGESNAWSLPATKPGRAAAALLLLAFAAAMFRWRHAPVAAAPLAAAAALTLAGHQPTGLLPYDDAWSRNQLALIDFSHQPYASKHSSTGAGLHGVSINLLRYGLLPVTMNEWDPGMLERARYLILNAPRRPLTAADRKRITRFMENGGTVILGCGYQHAAASRQLLEPLGIAIGGIPLGRFFDKPAFQQPVSFMCAWEIAAKPPEAAVLCAYDDQRPLMIALPVGKGKLIVIADSEFLHNRNVEGHENHDPANTTFLKNLFDFAAQ